MSDVLNRFLRYIKVPSMSDPANYGTLPSAQCEFDMARLMADELRELGLEGVKYDDKSYVYGYLPASEGCENAPRIGFIAHMDTSPDFCGENINPIIHENYDGGDVQIGERVLRVADFPHLARLKGCTLITTDGSTLLGGDDKAGIAEIVTMLEQVIAQNIPHGRIAVCFTPDEEIGAGPDGFDIEEFASQFAYTVDGGEPNGICYENFNAAAADFEINGFNIHPGKSKNRMVNASLVAMEINSMLPAGETPRHTEGREGFFHLGSMQGNVEKAAISYIVRDHSLEKYFNRIDMLRHIERLINEKYGEGTAKLTIREQYRNMMEQIKPCMHIVENAMTAIREAGLEPVSEPMRGGTDGARLSYMGLPCPNLGTGGYAGHGPYEHISVEGMEKCIEVLINVVKLYAAM